MSETQAVKILVIDDEIGIRRFLRAYLESQGHEVLEAATGKDGLAQAASHLPAIILLDLGLPDLDGLDVLLGLQGWCNAPVIVLSARDQEQDKVAALDAGAVDYLTKPFGVAELGARIRACLRRAQSQGRPTQAVVEAGELRIDMAQRRVFLRGEPVHLTPIEFKLLSYFAKNADKVLTHNQLLREIWGKHSDEQAHYTRIYVHQLRQKIEDNPAKPVHLLTETGVGYRFFLHSDRDEG